MLSTWVRTCLLALGKAGRSQAVCPACQINQGVTTIWQSLTGHSVELRQSLRPVFPVDSFFAGGRQSLKAFSSEPPSFENGDQYAVRQLVVTASGPDRAGIVSRLTKRVLEVGGNVEESKMARLAGDFSILMLVSVNATSASKAEEVRKKLMTMEGLHVHTRWTTEEQAVATPQKRFRKISLRGADNPGLVYNVTEYLASRHINIEALNTSTEEAPFGGTTLFTMDGVVAIPPGISTSSLIGDLDALASTLGVDIEISNMGEPEDNRGRPEGNGKGGDQGSSQASRSSASSGGALASGYRPISGRAVSDWDSFTADQIRRRFDGIVL